MALCPFSFSYLVPRSVVPRMKEGTVFATFEEFENELREFEKRTFSVWKVLVRSLLFPESNSLFWVDFVVLRVLQAFQPR